MTETARARLVMPLGEAIYTQRSIRRLRPDPLPTEDISAIVEAASKAPNGGNAQPARYLVLTDPDVIRRFGALYREAWWAKRRDEGRPWTRREEIPAEERVSRSAALLADEIAAAPCIVLALTERRVQASSVVPGVQNLMLAARALGIGSVPTTLHPQVMDRVYALLGIPATAEFHLCIPLGYPRGRFGPTRRRPTAETTYFDRWGAPVPWAGEPPVD
ncbi:MAG TPA: nitroreductase family protein [Thermomicrobiales bacterium]|nr:nitroreductase family protein [Thermomicrobiales bacterium]